MWWGQLFPESCRVSGCFLLTVLKHAFPKAQQKSWVNLLTFQWDMFVGCFSPRAPKCHLLKMWTARMKAKSSINYKTLCCNASCITEVQVDEDKPETNNLVEDLEPTRTSNSPLIPPEVTTAQQDCLNKAANTECRASPGPAPQTPLTESLCITGHHTCHHMSRAAREEMKESA